MNWVWLLWNDAQLAQFQSLRQEHSIAGVPKKPGYEDISGFRSQSSVGAHHENAIFHRDRDDERPDDRGQNAERALRRKLASGRLDHRLQGIQGTRPEVAEYHTQRGKACQLRRLRIVRLTACRIGDRRGIAGHDFSIRGAEALPYWVRRYEGEKEFRGGRHP